MNAYKEKDSRIQQIFFQQILKIIDPDHFFSDDIKDWLKGEIETYIANYSSTISNGDIFRIMVSQ